MCQIFFCRASKISTKRLLASSLLSSICMSARNNSAPTRVIFFKFYIWQLGQNLSRKIQVSLKSDKNNGYLTWRHTYLLTYSMEQSPSWEANGSAASQEIPRIFGTRRFIAVLTSARHHPYPEPTPSSHHNPPNFLKIHLNIILPSTSGSPQWQYLNLKCDRAESIITRDGWRKNCRIST